MKLTLSRLSVALLLAGVAGGANAQVVVSQVYGGGGNTGAPYNRDYVELFNRGSASVSLNGMTVQYASATGTGNFSVGATLPNVTLAPGQYFLVGMASGANGAALPTVDASGTSAMSGTAGKVILANSTTFHPIATDIRTGRSVDLAPYITDKRTLMTALRASAGLPLLAGPPVRLGEGSYFDGGLTETVPIRTAVTGGATHALVLRTRRADELRPPAPLLHRVIGGGYMRAIAPGAFRAWNQRPVQQAIEDSYLAELGDQILQVHPPTGSPAIDSAARDTDLLTRALDIGRTAVHALLDGTTPRTA